MPVLGWRLHRQGPVVVMKRRTFMIDPDTLAKLRAIKIRTGISESEQVRQGIRCWLESQGWPIGRPKSDARATESRVDTPVRKRHLLHRLHSEIVGGQIRRKSSRHRSDHVDRGAIGVHGTNVVVFAKEEDEVPPGTAAGITDARTRGNASAQNLIEQVDVDLAKQCLEIGHVCVAPFAVSGSALGWA